MSKNVMQIAQIKNHVQRNGFDLSYRNVLTANVGELVPFDVREVLPGDRFKITPKFVTRTSPLNSAAYTRFKEYVDYYFVPYHQMWRFSENFFTQLPNTQHSTGVTQPVQPSTDVLPNIDARQLLLLIQSYVGVSGPDTVDDGGQDRAKQIVRLSNLLGYGDLSQLLVPETNLFPSTTKLNIFPWLAYHKIYSDYYRYDQWETSNPNTFNVDYVLPSGNKTIDISSLFHDEHATKYPAMSMFDMCYANLPLDYFTGILPNAQYGSTASVYVSGDVNDYTTNFEFDVLNPQGSTLPLSLDSSGNLSSTGLTQSSPRTSVNATGTFELDMNDVLSFDVLSLRKAQALQRYKEITQSNKYNMRSQFKAHWNVNIPDGRDDRCRYLGGKSNVLSINPIVNTNITNGQPADYAGFCSGSSVSDTIDFESKEFGIIIGIYHCVPLSDYKSNGLNPYSTKIHFSDFAQPCFDKIGMQTIPFSQYSLGPSNVVDSEAGIPNYSLISNTLGYVPRYADYKTTFDRLSTGMIEDFVNYRSYVDFAHYYPDTNSTGDTYYDFWFRGKVNYRCFKVSRYMTASLFSSFDSVNPEHAYASDNLLLLFENDCYCVRSLDVNGLPY